jgi:hypothetical protein
MNKDTLYIEKAKLIESIVDINSVDIIKDVRSFVQKAVAPSRRPAMMTVEALKKEVAAATEDALNGNGITHDDLIKEMKTWR